MAAAHGEEVGGLFDVLFLELLCLVVGDVNASFFEDGEGALFWGGFVGVNVDAAGLDLDVEVVCSDVVFGECFCHGAAACVTCADEGDECL